MMTYIQTELRIRKYCAGAEHCTKEVRDKLIEWEMDEIATEALIQKLTEEKFIDDGRYATSYVRDKWNLASWGKTKIRYHLLQKEIPEDLIEQALTQISDTEYRDVIADALRDKWIQAGRQPDAASASKILVFGAQRGYEEEVMMLWFEKNGFEI